MFEKTRRSGFHESYYDHPCLIVSERDVLETDISGAGWVKACQRKWYDLFLLSYSDARAGDYYHSTHAMKMDRKFQFHRHRYCIHPLSKFRLYWDILILHTFIIYKVVVLCMSSVIGIVFPNIVYYLAMLFEVFTILDLFINTRTGFIDSMNRKIVLDKQLALQHYCSTKLFFHTLSSIPLVFIMFLRYGYEIDCRVCKFNHFNCAINFFTIFSLFRIYELSAYWHRESITYSKTVFYHFLRIGVIVFFVLIQFLYFNDTISVMTLMESSANKSIEHFLTTPSFFNVMFTSLNRRKSPKSDDFFVNAHFWRTVSFFTRPSINMQDVRTDTYYTVINPHPLLKFMAYGLLAICTIWLLIECFFFIIREAYFDSEVCRKKEYLLNLVKTRQLPERSYTEMKQYFDFTAAKLKLIEKKNRLYRCLPEALKDEVSWCCYNRLITRIPYFSEWPREVIEKLVVLIKVNIYLENDMIAEVGVQGDGLMIVNTGVLAVYTSHHEEVGHLIDGDYFGELSLVTDREVRASSVVAVSSCTVLLLEKILFRQIMRRYPRLFYSLEKELKKEYGSHRSTQSFTKHA